MTWSRRAKLPCLPELVSHRNASHPLPHHTPHNAPSLQRLFARQRLRDPSANLAGKAAPIPTHTPDPRAQQCRETLRRRTCPITGAHVRPGQRLLRRRAITVIALGGITPACPIWKACPIYVGHMAMIATASGTNHLLFALLRAEIAAS